MLETTPEQTIVALSLANRLYLTKEERDLSSLIRHSLHGDILVGLASLALHEDITSASVTVDKKHKQQLSIIQTCYDLDEGRLRNIEDAAKKLSWRREKARRVQTEALTRMRHLETPMWQTFKIFFLKAITRSL